MSRLPVITDKPCTPKRNPEYGMPEERECKSESCPNREPHTHTYERTNPPENGAGWLERKASGELIYHTPWLKTIKPFELKPLKPRVETASKALVRMKKECEMPEDKLHLIGRPTTDGYTIIRTNGHWALLEPAGETIGTPKPIDSLGITPKHQPIFLDDPEFYLALKRARIMADEKSHCVYLIGKENEIRISSNSEAGAFDETIPATFERPWKVALSADYLEIALGSWPLTIYVNVKDEDSAVIFEPITREWRFVVMPMQAEWSKLPKLEEGL